MRHHDHQDQNKQRRIYSGVDIYTHILCAVLCRRWRITTTSRYATTRLRPAHAQTGPCNKIVWTEQDFSFHTPTWRATQKMKTNKTCFKKKQKGLNHEHYHSRMLTELLQYEHSTNLYVVVANLLAHHLVQAKDVDLVWKRRRLRPKSNTGRRPRVRRGGWGRDGGKAYSHVVTCLNNRQKTIDNASPRARNIQ